MNVYIGGLLTLATVAGGGWGAHGYLHGTFAGREVVQIAGAQVDYLIQVREENLVRQIAELERKDNLTQTQRDHLKNLRQQLEEIRRVRRGK
jgi:hypothetical protein